MVVDDDDDDDDDDVELKHLQSVQKYLVDPAGGYR